jgi:hypothetical protein
MALQDHASWLNYHDGVDLHRCHFGLAFSLVTKAMGEVISPPPVKVDFLL